jgi:hypothetical protein
MKLEQKKIEFLKTILDSVLSLPYEKEIPKLDITSVTTNKIKILEPSLSYAFRLQKEESNLRFVVNIYKYKNKRLFRKNVYLMQIDILNSGNYIKETIIFDSRIDCSYNTLNDIFNHFDERYLKFKEDTLVNKMDEYITEWSKFISKDISRNAALEKILKK